MGNEAIIAQLQALGPLPDASNSQSAQYPLLKFDALVQQLSVPLCVAHLVALVNLGPPPDGSSYEVEWALVHAVDTASVTELDTALLLATDTEVKRIVAHRLANYKARHVPPIF